MIEKKRKNIQWQPQQGGEYLKNQEKAIMW
jgi:hypothetical protein